MANIKNYLDNIKGALFGKDVRRSIHDGIDAINKEVESTTGRQVDLENTFDQLVINAGNSNAEIVDARVKSDGTSYSKLGDRLNEVDSQLEHISINVKNFGAKGDGLTDDTEAIKKAINSGLRIFFPEGNYIISESLELTSNKTFYGVSSRKSKITQTTDNIPVVIMGAESCHIHDLWLNYSNRQVDNKWGNNIHCSRLRESVIERMYLSNGYNNIYCERFTPSDSDTSSNYIYSTTIRDIRCTRYVNYSVYLSCYNAGNTGCVFSNIYTIGWDNYENKTKFTTNGVFYFQGFSESCATQLNAEHVKTKNVFVFNTCDTFSIDSFHIEGFENNSNYNGIFDISHSDNTTSTISLKNGLINYCNLSNNTGYGLLRVKSKKSKIYIENINARDNIIGSLNYAPSIAYTSTSDVRGSIVKIINSELNEFMNNGILYTSSLNTTKQRKNLIQCYNDKNYYIEKANGTIEKIGNLPDYDEWEIGDIIYKYTPDTHIGWTCVAGGDATIDGMYRECNVTTTQWQSTITVDSGTLKNGDKFTIEGIDDTVFTCTSNVYSGNKINISPHASKTVANANTFYVTNRWKEFGEICD